MKKFIVKMTVHLFVLALIVLVISALAHFLGVEATLTILACIGTHTLGLRVARFVYWLFNDKENKNEKG